MAQEILNGHRPHWGLQYRFLLGRCVDLLDADFQVLELWQVLGDWCGDKTLSVESLLAAAYAAGQSLWRRANKRIV